MTWPKVCLYQVGLIRGTCLLEKWLISSRSGVFYVCEMQNVNCGGELLCGVKDSLQPGGGRCAEEEVTQTQML